MEHGKAETEAGLFENLRLELRRGCLSLAVLSQLRTERYGYTLRKALEEAGLEIDEGTLYPLLRRLESQGLLQSEWREENKRRKRFYKLKPAGERIFEQLSAELRRINTSLDRIIAEADLT
jgi:PadR family transcriptional regulator, regulatory protein PadR